MAKSEFADTIEAICLAIWHQGHLAREKAKKNTAKMAVLRTAKVLRIFR